MPNAYVVLLIANLVYATGYTVTRVVLVDVGPATLALARLALGALVLVPLARVLHPGAGPVSGRDRWRIFQPLLGALLGVWWLGEPLTAFMVAGGALILVGVHLAVRAGRRTRPRSGLDRRDGLESSP